MTTLSEMSQLPNFYLKGHEDLGFEIASKDDDFRDLEELALKLMKQKPKEEIKSLLLELKSEKELLHQNWQEKDNWLKQCKDLMIFNQEADHLETTIKSHNTFLEFDDVGITFDDVESLLKRHENFMTSLAAHEERVLVFNDMANKLIYARHYNSNNIDEKRKLLLSRRTLVKDKAVQRKQLLLDALAFQEFKADTDEFIAWCMDKIKTAEDQNYRDLIGIEKKLQKHEAFEAELNASQGRLVSLIKTGQDLVGRSEITAEKIEQTISLMNSQWDELVSRTEERGKGLRQANAQVDFYNQLENARSKLTELERSVSSNELGKDLRSCKELIKKHQAMEADLSSWQAKVGELEDHGRQMSASHFDGISIVNAASEVTSRFKDLTEPVVKRRNFLNESLKFFQFEFELNTELQWITEHEAAVSATDAVQNLTDAQNVMKKHQKLEREVLGHQSQIDKSLANGEALISQDHYSKGSVASKCKELKDAWKMLNEMVLQKRKRLDTTLKTQTFLTEANEIEAYINEKLNIMNNADNGKDEDAAVKMLTKHKALELEVDTYAGLVSELKHQAKKLTSGGNNPDEDLIESRAEEVSQQMKNLQKTLTLRQARLVESKHCHEYFRESGNFLEWVGEQMQTAQSDDYGHDYEHLQLLKSKFYDFKCRVESNNERFKQCEEHAAKLSKTEKFEEVQKRQAELQDAWGNLLDVIASRDQKLAAAGEIHKFNRDVADALSRILEKYSLIDVDHVGKDLQSVQSLLRKHEGYENDLVALESQLQALIDDSARLQSAYPGGNAEHIRKQQELVVQNWNNLQEKAAHRKGLLQASFSLQKFISSVRDLEKWADLLGTEIGTQEKVRDAFGVQALKTEHERIKAEIETREADFTAVVKTGEKLMEDETFGEKEEVRSHLTKMLQCREALHTAWQLKKVYLDQLSDLHFFLSAAKQLDLLSVQQENYLNSADFGQTVEDVSNSIKKHEGFEKILSSQEERLVALQQSGLKLIQQNHFDSGTIKRRLDEVSVRRLKVKENSSSRKQMLHDALLLAQFRRSVAEAESWIDERSKLLKAQVQHETEVKFQTLQAYVAELNGHKKNVEQIRQTGEFLLSRKLKESEEIRNELKELIAKVEQYEQSLDAQIFKRDADQLEAWLESRFKDLQDDNLGDSVAAIEDLLKRHEEFEQMILAQEAKLSNLNRMTLKEKVIEERKRAEEERRRQELARQKEDEERRRTQDVIYSKPTEEGTRFGIVRSLIGTKNVKRVESVRAVSKAPTPVLEKLPPVEIEGYLERKHENQSGGKRAGTRSWKGYYTVLCGQILCFFRDEKAFVENIAASSPVSVFGAKCSKATDYTKKKHVFRLILNDGSEFLFALHDESSLQEWMNKIAVFADEPPSHQLSSYHQNSGTNGSQYDSLDGNLEARADNNGLRQNGSDETDHVAASFPESKRPPPPPPSGSSPHNSRPPAPLPSNSSKIRPPMPPPRTTTMPENLGTPSEQQILAHATEPENKRRSFNEKDAKRNQHRMDITNGSRVAPVSYRQTLPHPKATNGDFHESNGKSLSLHSGSTQMTQKSGQMFLANVACPLDSHWNARKCRT